MGFGMALCVFVFRAPHKLSSLISTLLRERQGGQVNANPGSLTTAAALWARHSQHLKNATSKALEDNDDAASGNNPSTTTDAASQQAEQDQGKFHLLINKARRGAFPNVGWMRGVRAWGTTYL